MHLIAHNPGCCNYTACSLIKCFPFGFKLNLNLELYSERVGSPSLATAASASRFVRFAHPLFNKCTRFPGTPLILLSGLPGKPQPSQLGSTTCSPARPRRSAAQVGPAPASPARGPSPGDRAPGGARGGSGGAEPPAGPPRRSRSPESGGWRLPQTSPELLAGRRRKTLPSRCRRPSPATRSWISHNLLSSKT